MTRLEFIEEGWQEADAIRYVIQNYGVRCVIGTAIKCMSELIRTSKSEEGSLYGMETSLLRADQRVLIKAYTELSGEV